MDSALAFAYGGAAGVVAEAEAFLRAAAPGDPLDEVALLLDWDYEREPDGPDWVCDTIG